MNSLSIKLDYIHSIPRQEIEMKNKIDQTVMSEYFDDIMDCIECMSDGSYSLLALEYEGFQIHYEKVIMYDSISGERFPDALRISFDNFHVVYTYFKKKENGVLWGLCNGKAFEIQRQNDKAFIIYVFQKIIKDLKERYLEYW